MATTPLMRISIQLHGQTWDLQIPRQMTLTNLATQLPDALASLRVSLPPRFTLAITNKRLVVDRRSALGNYPLNDGDQLRVISHEV
ncbi:MAG: type VII secretion protein, YukD family [Limosilactobacillus fermentum]|uniref:type VII secretion protein, YukD family n=1 Tax=Limosilactobacillus fermentum TaxID=1613 RepID=UPI0022EBAF4D|nr:type VII secretion protein, YukD family [Limosilactobacillus fermentum]MDA3723567.1 type VII secretion protein, YukD family [Limosilactobacillus fermentum]MDA3762102.1 type VII secretion protein, YukD family [Limosilactobacillus fermentum]